MEAADMTDVMAVKGPASMPGRGSRWLRGADFWLGVPLVRLCGWFKRARALPASPRRIALLKTAAIGDVVLMSGPLRDLRQAYPQAHITLLCGPSNAAMGRLLEGVDDVLQLPIGPVWRAWRLIAPRRFDVVIDFGAWPRLDALYASLARNAYRIGFAKEGQYRHHLYHAAVPHRADRHELENYRQLLAAAGVKAVTAPQLRRAPAPPPDLAQALDGHDYVVLHLWPGGSNAAAREWPLARWQQLARSLMEEGYAVVLTGAPSDAPLNRLIADTFGAAHRSRVHNAAGRSLAQTAAVLSHAACTVSVNTGVMHMAAALGVPVVGLHGATAVHRWGPVGPRAVAIESNVPGCGCLDLGFEPVPRQDCTHSITVEQVLAAVAEQLGGARLGRERRRGSTGYSSLPSVEQDKLAPCTSGSGRVQAGFE
jgi:ADP-heptose:LPS heptosyltransferase